MQGVLGFVFAVALLSVVSFLLFLVITVQNFQEANPLFTSEFTKVAIASVFGCFGGVVSLLTRLPEFETLKEISYISKSLGGNAAHYRRNLCTCRWGTFFSENY
jgi:hypothetical protein